jgi:uncharacterized protein YggE
MATMPLAALAALLLTQAPGAPRDTVRTIQVSGEGRAFAAPDVARVTVGVDVEHASLARATADAGARMKGVLAALEKAGVAPKDARTVRYDVEVKRRVEKLSGPGPGEPSGYRVMNQVQVTVRDLGKVGAVLDQVVAAGANDVGGLSFDKEDPSAERSRALEAAVADARAKAGVLARAAGATLGEALQVTEGGRGPTPMHGAVAFRTGGPVPIAEGQLEIAASVDVTFALR